MKVGNYQLGKYYGIIKCIYEDGSIDYETRFSDSSDLMESAVAIERCIGKMVGIATDKPRKLAAMEVIRGKEEVLKELTSL